MEAARARAERLRARLPEAVAFLRSRGARRIVLFGSLAHGQCIHARSDIDLAVEGLDAAAARDAAWDLMDRLRCDVDVICIERAADSLRHRIVEDGVELDVAG